MILRRTRNKLLLATLIFAGFLATQWPPSARYVAEVNQAVVAAVSWTNGQ